MNLEELWLEENMITYIPGTIKFLKNLRILALHNNAIASITPEASPARLVNKLVLVSPHIADPDPCQPTSLSLHANT